MANKPPIMPVGAMTSGINMLIYADNGVGKTPLIGTGDKTLIFDADKGSGSAAAFGNSKADKWLVNSWDDLEQGFEHLRHEQHGYKWAWLDSVSTAQEIGLEDIMDGVVASRPHRKVYHPDKGEYGENMNRLKLWTRHMAALPINFGITAHPILASTTEGDDIYMPFVQGKNMIHVVCSYMDVIGYLTIVERQGKSHQVLYTQRHNGFYGRDRFKALGGRMIAPSIPKIEAAIANARRASSRTTTATPQKQAATKPTGRKLTIKKGN